MATLYPDNLKTKEGLNKAVEAYKTISVFSESELETIEILSNEKERSLMLRSIEESKNNKIYPIKSIL